MEVFVVTLVTTVLQVYMLPSGFHRTDAEYLQMLFRHCDSESDVIRCPMNLTLAVTLGILKFWLTALSFGMMVPAGLFMPNLVIGACMGWTFGTLLDDMVSDNHLMFRTFTDCTAQDLNCVVPSVYAIVAATAVMGGVNRMTLSLVTIMFELTGGLEYIIPVTIGVMCSKWVAEWLGGKESIYNKLMDVKGLPFLDPRFEGRMDITSHASIGEIMSLSTADLPLLYERMTTKETLEVLKTSATGFVIVKNEMDHRIVGYISRRQLSMALEDLDGELSEMGMMAQDDIPVVFGANGNIAPETPKFLMKRTPSVLRSDSSQVSRFAYDLHGYVDHSPVTVRKEVEVARVVLMIRRLGLTTILVADESNILKGVLTKLEVIKHLHKVHEYSERAEREYASCPRGPPLASSTKDHPKGGFHQSELEAEVHSISELEHLPALPPAAMIIRRKSARPKK